MSTDREVLAAAILEDAPQTEREDEAASFSRELVADVEQRVRRIKSMTARLTSFEERFDVRSARPLEWINLAADAASGIPPLDYLARGIRLVRGDVALFAGAAGSGKSTTAAALTVAIASGTPFLSERTGDGEPVLYIDGEAGRADLVRLFSRLGAAEIPNLFVCSDPDLSLVDSESVRRLEREIREKRPALAVLDTLTAFMRGVNENDAGQVSAAYGILHGLRDQYGCAFLLVHHLSKPPREGHVSPQDRIRGSTVHQTQPSLLLTCEPIDGALDLSAVKRRGGRREEGFARVRLIEPDGPDGMLLLENIGRPETVEAALDTVSRAVVGLFTPTRPRWKRAEIVAELAGRCDDDRAVDRALRHLAGTGGLRREGRGVYVTPEFPQNERLFAETARNERKVGFPFDDED